MDLSQLRTYLEMRCIYPDLNNDPIAAAITDALQRREMEAVTLWGLFLAWIPPAKRTPTLCQAAVQSHSRAIIWVPHALHSVVSWSVIEKDPMAIQFICDPPLELAEAAVRAAPGAAWVLTPRNPELEALSDQLRINAYVARTPRIQRSVSSTP